jgi:hypothetical protein
MVDNILDGYIKNLQQHPDFYAFLFEMWCAGRLSKKIRKELESCVEQVTGAIKKTVRGCRKK